MINIMSTEVYFSVDVEADGPVPGLYSLSSFGAVAFGHRSATNKGADGTGLVTVDIDASENAFYSELAPISEVFDPAAAAVAGLNRQHLIDHGETPVASFNRFVYWVDETTERIGGPGARAVFVAYPLPYDWMWIYWYLMTYAGRSPFGHSSALDAKTMLAVKMDRLVRFIGKRSIPKSLMSNRRHTHNALDDAKEQAELFINLLRWNPSHS